MCGSNRGSHLEDLELWGLTNTNIITRAIIKVTFKKIRISKVTHIHIMDNYQHHALPNLSK
jgi:phage terminase large subunit-like protein